jgi:hypothetical protein
MDLSIRISETGELITGLYTDKLDWTAMGDCTINRASDVRFDSTEALWKVYILDEDNRVLDKGHKLRADAIQAEVDYFNVRGPR